MCAVGIITIVIIPTAHNVINKQQLLEGNWKNYYKKSNANKIVTR